MLLSSKVIVVLCAICEVFGYNVDNLTEKISLANGKTIRGTTGDEYQSFVGIPFAKPPVGQLRFANPEPANWTGNFDAVNQPDVCIQMNFLIPNPTIAGSEDCLYLNIYRPNVDYNPGTKLDVMVYIHGGGFFSGSIIPIVTGPKYFMQDKSVILVMMQYRLSTLGFLSTGDQESPGNFGLKDQSMALKWVKENIERFGGNPNSITIFGQSAGAASVHMHMLSPLSRNLFNKAIAMSGSAIGPYNYPTPNPIELARRQAKAVNITNADRLSSRDLVQKLREASAADLISSVADLKIFSVDPLTLYRTVVEPKKLNGAFLTEDPWTILKRGDIAKVPFLTGVVDVEGAVRGAAITSNPTLLDELNSRMDELLPELLELNIRGHKLTSFIRKLKDRYLNGLDVINETNKHKFIQIYTDYSFYYPMYKSLPYMSNNPVYLYKFSYRGQYSYSMVYTNTLADYGVVHCDDLIYLFESPALFSAGLNEYDQMASQKLIQTFTSFAKQGNPPRSHQLKKCHADDMNPICKYTHFYKNESGLINTEESNEFDLGMIEFWDELKDFK